ncbi:MAG: hypothetical protein ABSG86_08475 [Thermoguttaceae bacterium]|jgi:hypothetical protein
MAYPDPLPPDPNVEPVPLVVGAMMARVQRREKRPGPAGRLAAWLRRRSARVPEKTPGGRLPGAARRSRLIPARLQPRTLPPGVYEAGGAQLRAVWKLAALLAAALVASLLPAAWHGHLGLQASPGWARSVLLVAGLQGLYLVWMLNAPDWATVRVVTFVFAAVTTGYAVATTAVMATPVHYPLALGLGEVRFWAAGWCGGMVAAMGLCTFCAARLSAGWRRAFQQEIAERQGHGGP